MVRDGSKNEHQKNVVCLQEIRQKLFTILGLVDDINEGVLCDRVMHYITGERKVDDELQ